MAELVSSHNKRTNFEEVEVAEEAYRQQTTGAVTQKQHEFGHDSDCDECISFKNRRADPPRTTTKTTSK